MIPAAAPIARPGSILNPTMAAPVLALAGTPAPVVVLEVVVEFPPDVAEAGEVAVVVPVPLTPGPDEVTGVVPVDGAAEEGEAGDEVAVVPADEDAFETVDSVLKGRML